MNNLKNSTNPEELFDMSYSIKDDLKATPNNYEETIKGIALFQSKILNTDNIIDKAKLHSKLGFYLKIVGKFEESELSLKNAIELFTQEKDFLSCFVAKIRLAQNFQFNNNLYSAINLINDLEKELNKNFELDFYRDFIFQHKGKILFDLKNYKEALIYFNKALKIRTLKNNEELINSTKLAIAVTKNSMKKL